MRKRATWFIILWVCLLIGVSGLYQAAATPTGPQAGSSARAIAAAAVTLRLPAPPAGIDAVAMTETFEGTWPAPGWTVTDLSGADGGDYRWGRRDCHPRTGSFAGWSVGGGAQGSALSCAGTYPNNAHTLAVYGPLDLRGVTSGRLTYYVWGRTENDITGDYLLVGASFDGSEFFGTRYTGDWSTGNEGQGYYAGTYNLSAFLGQSPVWIGLEFVSDGSVNDIGMTVDDITLELSNVPPSPTPTQTPTASATATATATATPTTPGVPSNTPTMTPTTPGVPSNTPTETPTTPVTPSATATPTTTATPMLVPRPPVYLPLIMR